MRRAVPFALLLLVGALAAVQLFGQLAGVPAELLRGVADAPDHRAGVSFEHAHGQLDLTELVTPAAVQGLAHGVVADLPGLCS